MLTNIFNLIVQLWELGLFIIRWFDKNISVGWLAFGLAVLTFLRNNQKKLLQRFEYSSFICEFKTTITVYNNSLGTETSRFVGILVTNKKNYWYKKILFPWMIKHTKYDDEIYSYEMMVDIQKNEERQKTDFVAIKSHEMRIISIDKGVFLEAVKQRLINNREALRDFVNRRPIFIYFIHQTIGGKIKVFCLTVYYWDQIGKDIDEDKNIKSQRSLRTQSKDNASKLS